MDKKIRKNIIVIILSILVITLLMYIIFSKNGLSDSSERADFLKNMVNTQKELSYYLGRTSAETFGVYTNEQIITGVIDINKSDETKIKDNENNAIIPIVSIANNNIVKENDVTSYLVIKDNIKEVLNTDLKEFSGVSYYITNGNTLKVKFDTKPKWWDGSMNTLLLGNN